MSIVWYFFIFFNNYHLFGYYVFSLHFLRGQKEYHVNYIKLEFLGILFQVGRARLDSFSGSIVGVILHFQAWQRKTRAILWVKERRVLNLNSAFTMVQIWAIVLMHHQRQLQLLSKSLLLSGLKVCHLLLFNFFLTSSILYLYELYIFLPLLCFHVNQVYRLYRAYIFPQSALIYCQCPNSINWFFMVID